MLRNCLAAASRNLMRNRLYASINILGLAAAFTAVILIALYVRYERSYDRFLPGFPDIYRLSSAALRAGAAANATDDLRGPVAEELRTYFPQIRKIAELRIPFGSISLRRGAVESSEPAFLWADPEVFDVLPFPVAAGDARAALAVPDGLVLTRRMARRYFGKDLPLGETIEVNRERTLRVMAVLEDLPSNTHLNTEIFGSTRALPPLPPGNVYRAYVYLRLAPGAAPDALRAALPAFVDRDASAPVTAGKNSSNFELRLMPIADIHLQSTGARMKPGGDPRMLDAITLVGGLILLAAAINFINLMTARAARRGIEVGVRKAAGARRVDVLLQFVGEALVQAFIALLLAVAVAELLLPHLNAFVDAAIHFDYLHPAVLGGLLALTASVGVLAGLYPALLVSLFRPAAVLKGVGPQAPGSGRLRQLLVLLQFAILISLLLVTAVLQMQTRFGLQQGLRFGQDQLLTISMPPAQCAHSAFTEAVRALPDVRGAACGGIFGGATSQQYRGPGGREVALQNSTISPGMFELLDLEPVAGRFYADGRAGDAFVDDPRERDLAHLYPTVVNESAARALGFADAAAAIGQAFTNLSDARPGTQRVIIGVVPDFARNSVRTAIPPLLYNNSDSNRLHVRLRGEGLPGTVAEIDRLWQQYSPLPAPISRRFYDQYLQEQYGDLLRQGQLFLVFAVLALALTGVGLFGLAAFITERRTKEMGIRKALGANTADVLRLLLWQFSRPVVLANLVAWPVAGWTTQRWLENFAYHIDLPLWLFPAAGLVALLIALVTVSVHCVVVARAKPIAALRHE